MSIVWTGGFDKGMASLKGNRDNEWFNAQIGRAEQAIVVDGACRVEVRHGDTYSTYSDDRALLTGPSPQCWAHEGDTRFLRYRVQFPQSWVGRYPKADELPSWPKVYHDGGSHMLWHHDMGGAPELGSAPLYLKADHSRIYLVPVYQEGPQFSAPIALLPLAPVLRGVWQGFVVRTRFSEDPKKGEHQVWDLSTHQELLPTYQCQTLRPGSKGCYLSAGLYRRGTIGDMAMTWPIDPSPGVSYPAPFTPHRGQPVYSDLATQFLYLDDIALATTLEDFMSPTDPVPAPAVTAPGSYTPSPEDQKVLKQALATLITLPPKIATIQGVLTSVLNDVRAVLDKGEKPWPK
jgi:hypothetical protein